MDAILKIKMQIGDEPAGLAAMWEELGESPLLSRAQRVWGFVCCLVGSLAALGHADTAHTCAATFVPGMVARHSDTSHTK
eukprot:gene16966-57709_t